VLEPARAFAFGQGVRAPTLGGVSPWYRLPERVVREWSLPQHIKRFCHLLITVEKHKMLPVFSRASGWAVGLLRSEQTSQNLKAPAQFCSSAARLSRHAPQKSKRAHNHVQACVAVGVFKYTSILNYVAAQGSLWHNPIEGIPVHGSCCLLPIQLLLRHSSEPWHHRCAASLLTV